MFHTPFHGRTSALCRSLAWKEWAGHAAVCNYDRHSEREYFAFRGSAGLIDVSPLYKYEFRGADAALMLSRLWTRDITKIGVGRVVYGCMCDRRGRLLDDGTVSRLAPEHYRVTTSEPWLHWFAAHSRGMQVEVEESTRSLGALALQGPKARAVLAPITEFDLGRMRFFRVRSTKVAGLPVWISRTGYTGDLGYELWTAPAQAGALWDAIVAAGRPLGMEPAGLDAMDVARIEAGFVLQGIDYVSAPQCLIDRRTSSPDEAGLGWTVDLDRDPFVGQAAIRAERDRGPAWDLVGVQMDWAALDQLYADVGLPPHLAPVASRAAVPVFVGGQQVGQMTSSTWSPLLKQYIGLVQLRRAHAAEGTRLEVEHTVDFSRERLPATVVPRPFFDPERKRSTPGARK